MTDSAAVLSSTQPSTSARPATGRPMKVLFIDEYLPQEMLGIMWLSRAIKDAGHDAKCLFIPDKKWIEKLQDYAPDVVCYSVTTGMHLYFAEINRKVKQVMPNVLTDRNTQPPTMKALYLKKRSC